MTGDVAIRGVVVALCGVIVGERIFHGSAPWPIAISLAIVGLCAGAEYVLRRSRWWSGGWTMSPFARQWWLIGLMVVMGVEVIVVAKSSTP